MSAPVWSGPVSRVDGEAPAAVTASALHERLRAVREAMERAWRPDPADAERILKARARELARPAAAAAAEKTEVLAFRLAGQTYAIEPQHVARVCALDRLAPLPGVPAFVLGIAQVRGEIVSVVDLRRLLGLSERGLGQMNTLIVLQWAHMRFGVAADEIAGMRHLPRAHLLASLPTLEGAKERYLIGVTPEHIVVLDAHRLLSDERLVIGARPEAGGAHVQDAARLPRPKGGPG